MDPALQVRLLGAIEIIYHSRPLTLPTRKANLLFAFLVLHRPKAKERTLIAGLLWPDLPESRARRNLNTEIWRTRQALGDLADVLQVTATTIAFAPPFEYSLDLDPLDPLPDPAPVGQLRRAVENYRGDFLAGYYDDWVIAVQERLRGAYLQALTLLFRHHRERGDLASAVAAARRLLEQEPLRESVHRDLIELHIRLGDRAAALRQYRQCAEVLHRELGLAPMAETRALYQDLLDSFPRGIPEVFVGRETDLARLDDFVNREGQVLLIAAESGCGKTALVTAWSGREPGRQGIQVKCPPPGESAPFAPIVAALRGLQGHFGEAFLRRLPSGRRRQLSRLVPEWAASFSPGDSLALPPAEARERLFAAVEAAFRSVEGPVILFLDDLHHADPDSLAVLQHLLNRLPAGLFRLIGAYQPEVVVLEADHPLSPWLDLEPRREKWYLAPLSPNEAGALLQALAQTQIPPRALAERLYADSEGNPLFIMEALRDMFDRGTLVLGSMGGWGLSVEGLPGEVPIPSRVEDLIRQRLDRLPADSRSFLTVAAVLGSTFGYDLLLEAAGQAEERLLDALEMAVRASLVRESGDGMAFTFVHEKFRTVLLRDLPDEQRRFLYGRAAAALEHISGGREDEIVERLAFYHAESGVPENALPLLESAAGKAEDLHAYNDALGHIERALGIIRTAGEPDARSRFELEMRRLRMYRYLGRIAALRTLAADLVRLADGLGPAERARAGLLQGRNLIASGDWPEAADVLKKALQHAVQAEEKSQQSEALLLQATLAYHMRRPDLQKDQLKQALRLAEESSDKDLAARIRLEMAAIHGLPEQRAKGLYQGFVEARQQGSFVAFNQFVTSLVINFMYEGRYGKALETGQELSALAEEHGLETMRQSLWRVLSRCRNEIGDYVEARDLARRSMLSCRLSGYRYGEMRALACLAYAEAGLGRFERALPMFEQAMVYSEEVGARLEWFLFAFLAADAWLLHPADSAIPQAIRLVERTLAAAVDEGYPRACILAHTHLARIKLRQADPAAAQAHSARAVDILAEHGHAIGREHQVRFVHACSLRASGAEDWSAHLSAARADLARKSRCLPPGRLRRGYLENVPIHREIRSLPKP